MYPLLRQNIEKNTSLTDNDWAVIIDQIKFTKLKKNEFLQVQDSNNTYEAFVLRGAFKTYTLNENGTESILFFSFENDWVCTAEYSYHRKTVKHNIKAMEDSEILLIDKTNKIFLFEKVPQLKQFFITLLEANNILLQERLLDVLNKTSKQRYLDFTTKHSSKIKINNKNLSSYLGISHEFLSKIKKQLTKTSV